MQDASTTQQESRVKRTTGTFVGREGELRVVREALDTVLAGTRQVVLLTGEPGIGKTRIATELTELAGDRGALTLWGSCYEWEGAPAYWPWTQVLNGWLRSLGDDALAEAVRAHAGPLAQISSELSARVSAPLPLPPPAPEARHFQLLAAAGALLRDAAARQPLVIVLDDLHWADLPTLHLLLFVAQDLYDARLLLVATYRAAEMTGEHPGAAILADLARQAYCRRLSLRGLPKPQVAQLVALVSGQAQPPSLVDAVYAETDGNPFFVTEVARLLATERELNAGTGWSHRARVPESVRDAINRRLDRLSPHCVQALVAAAVLGRSFQLRVLAGTTGRSATELLDTLDAAVRAQVIVADDRPGSYRFSHALVQESLYQGLSPAERARLHLAAGMALQASDDHEPRWAELAHHFYLAQPLSERSDVQRYAELAGDEAMLRFAWDAAAVHYRHALDALPATETTHRCELLLALGDAHNRADSGAGDAPAARAAFLQAFDLARSQEDGPSMARAAIGYAGINLVAVFGGTRQLELLEEAATALGHADSPLRARLWSRLAMDLWNHSPAHAERAEALAAAAVETAERLGDPTVLAYALNAQHLSYTRPDHLAARTAIAVRLVAAAERAGDPIAASWGYLLQLNNFIEAGDLVEAERVMLWLQGFDERVHFPYLAQRVAAYRALLALHTGRYPEAAQQVERARSLWQSAAPRQHACQSFILLRDVGRLHELTEEIALPDGLHSWRADAQAHRMALALERGDVGAARADYAALVADDLTHVAFSHHWYGTLAMLADAATAFDDHERAARIYTWMAPYAERLVFDGSLAISHGPVARYLGRLAGVLGRWDEALHWLERSLAICDQLGLRPYTARTLLDIAELLVRRNAPGDRVAARAMAERAIAVAESIGMLGLVPRAGAVRDALSKVEIPDLGLTPRELDVLRLIAEGLTDAEVAERLSLSPRTVGSHLTSVYGKLQVQSRTAAARIALEHGLA